MVLKIFLLSVFIIVAIEGHRLNCLLSQFRCISSGVCIRRTWFCDGDQDCSDNSDEKYCDIDTFYTRCPKEDSISWKLCDSNKRCYPNAWRCDGLEDCRDSSDEVGCTGIETEDAYTTDIMGTDMFITDDATTSMPYDSTYITYETVFYETESSYIPPNAEIENPAQFLSRIRNAVDKLTAYIMGTRANLRSINKWGPHLVRTSVSLFLADPSFFSLGNQTGEEIAYELSLQLMSKLALKKKFSTQELSLFINALTVSCINLKDFFGVDLVAELRNRVNNSSYPNPFTILTLCNAGDAMGPSDVVKLKSAFDVHHRPIWTDTQALATVAMACISSRSSSGVDTSGMLREMVAELERKQHINGTVGSLRTTALVLQALIATNSYPADFDVKRAFDFVLQQINSTQLSFHDMYYVLPVLNDRSLVNISSSHCELPVRTTIPELEPFVNIRKKLERRIQVQFSVYIGNDMDFVRTWKLKVSSNNSFYQVLENVSSMEPDYKVQYSVSGEKKPYVSGFGKYFDDAEDGKFWFTYSKAMQNTSELKLEERSPVDILMKEDEEIILWYRSGTWMERR